jgi:AcrR family transcriptional regulator
MSRKVSPKRTYDSTRRKEQAAQTRRQIITAARELFISRGYAGATMEAIADAAGVAVETVYAAFGSKRAILAQVLQAAVGGDEQPIPILEREGPRSVQQDTDQRRQIEGFARDMYEIMSRAAPVFEVMRAAAKTEPDIAGLMGSILEGRLEGMTAFVRALMKNGPLREGLTVAKAAETVWAVSSAEVFTLLVVERGWSEAEYKRWLADALGQLLLP